MLTNSTMLQILGMVDVAICTLEEGEDEVGRCGEWQMTDAWKDRGEGGLWKLGYYSLFQCKNGKRGVNSNYGRCI